MFVDNTHNPEANKQPAKKEYNGKITLNYMLTKGGMMVSDGSTGSG
jgi:hypothetical protein